jgi:transcriptional regulator with GAF, ATPase, and Fis domain
MAADPPCNDLGLVGDSEPMRRLRDDIKKFGGSDGTVLLLGENGTGKERVARALHSCSPRNNQTFVAVNCAALSENLLDDEMFGHERGAFTGADKVRKGRFEYADKGTLFLDEVGDMPLPLQAKVLRVIQECELNRIGSNETIKVNVRLIAATNRDLEKMISENRFREDLFYRLRVLDMRTPPLRERGATDVMILARHFLDREATKAGKGPAQFTADAERRLQAHQWPGNVRELENTIFRAVLLAPTGADGIMVGVEHLNVAETAGAVLRPYDPTNEPTPSDERLADKVLDALASDEPPTLGLRHGADSYGRVATFIMEEFVVGFADFLRTDKGIKHLTNFQDDHLISLFGLASRRTDNKNKLMAELYDRLKKVLGEARQELPASAAPKRRGARQKATPNGD